MSAQEAVYRLLSLHLKDSNCSVVFVNTSPPESQVSILQPVEELFDCDSDDENVFKLSLIDRYAAQPESLESMCLAECASQYVLCRECSKIPLEKLLSLKMQVIALSFTWQNESILLLSDIQVSNKKKKIEKLCICSYLENHKILAKKRLSDSYAVDLDCSCDIAVAEQQVWYQKLASM